MKTAITDMFGIDVPILAFTHCRDVVVAVTKAGGFGVLGAAGHSDQQLEIDLDWIEDELGGRPYGIDLIVPAKYALKLVAFHSKTTALLMSLPLEVPGVILMP